MKTLLSKGIIALVLLTPAQSSCGASQRSTTMTAVNVASAVLDRIEAFADEHMADELALAKLNYDKRKEREVLLYYRTAFEIINRAQNYLLYALEEDDLGNETAAKAAIRCYQEQVVHLVEFFDARHLNIVPILRGAVPLIPKDEANQCQL